MFCILLIHSGSCSEFLVEQMSDVLELKDPSTVWDDGRQLEVEKEMLSEGAPLCEGCVDGIW